MLEVDPNETGLTYEKSEKLLEITKDDFKKSLKKGKNNKAHCDIQIIIETIKF